MSAKPTPGPWSVEWKREIVADRKWRALVALASAGEVWMHGHRHEISTDEAEANARLIAAAPEMLAALKAAQELVAVAEGMTGCRGDDVFVWGIRDTINAAIAKAEGQRR